MGKKFACHKISEGKAQAEAIISKDRIMFYQVRPEDGMMEEKNHYLEGRIIAKAARAAPSFSRTACTISTASTTCPLL